MAIQSFVDERVQSFFVSGELGKKFGWKSVATVVRRKLDLLHFAKRLDDLRAPPGNRLETLKGNLLGRHSIRVNGQWRIVFRWTEDGPAFVDVCDYH